jgi:hypothetical protein
VHDLVEHAVDAEPHAEALLVRLEMDVRGVLLDRIRHDDVDELDDGGVLGGRLEALNVDVLGFLEDLEVLRLRLRHLVHDLLELDGVRGAVVLVDRLLDRDLRGHDGLDVVPGHELDVVHREDVRRVDHGDGQGGPGSADRHDQIFLRDLRRDQLDDRFVDLDRQEIDRGDAVLLREELGDVVFLDDPQLDEVETDLAAVDFLVFERLGELLLGDQMRLDQHLAQLDRHALPLEWSVAGAKTYAE